MREAPDGRTIFIWKGQTPAEDTARLTAAVAELCVAELFELNGELMWLDGDQLIPITKDILRTIIAANFTGVRLLRHGTGYRREFFTFEFPQLADPSKQPGERVLLDMIAALLGRVVRGPSTPRGVPAQLRQAVRDRLRSGEPARRIAESFRVDVEAVERLAR